jgi:galactose oxidase-like protein
MAYDVADGYVLLWGERYHPASPFTIPTPETWIFQSGKWAELNLTSQPTPRNGASMAYDKTDGYVLLFGGGTGIGYCGGYVCQLNDTWKFSAGAWTNITPTHSPGVRSWASMTFDGKDGYILLFGGNNAPGAGSPRNDTWKFSHGIWTQVQASRSPPEVDSGSSMAFDQSDGYVLLYGAWHYCPNVCESFTWTYSGGKWTNRSGPIEPSPRIGAGMVFDPKLNGIVLFAGLSSSQVFNDTWTYLNGTWKNVTPAISPHPMAPLLAYNPAKRNVVAVSSDNYGGTWTFT